MALQSNAALLDELMGKYRNVAPGASVNAVRFDDEEVCKYFLVNFCPHELFVNTRADLGPCTKIHDEELKKQYEKSSRFGKLGYEDDFERFLRSMLNDVERRIRRGMERLRLTQTDSTNQKTPIELKQERVAYIKEQINAAIKEAESLGEQGNIDEAQNKLEESEKLKSECKYLEIQLEMAAHNSEQKQMEVCNVCGSFLIINDAQSRVEEHISGKQHKGYAQLRTALEDIRKKRIEELEKREKERELKDRDRYVSRNKSPDRYRNSREGRDSRDYRNGRDDRDNRRDYNNKDNYDKYNDNKRRNKSPSPSKSYSSPSISKRNGSYNSYDRDYERDRGKERGDRRTSNSDYTSSSKSRERSRHGKRDESEASFNESPGGNSSKNSKMNENVRNEKLDQETDEFFRLVDGLTKSKETNEEKEEGEEDDNSKEGDVNNEGKRKASRSPTESHSSKRSFGGSS